MLRNSSACSCFTGFLDCHSYQPSPRQQMGLYNHQGYSSISYQRMEWAKNSVGSKSSKNIIRHSINTICTLKEMIGGCTKQSQICLRRENTCCVAKHHDNTASVIYMHWKHALGVIVEREDLRSEQSHLLRRFTDSGSCRWVWSLSWINKVNDGCSLQNGCDMLPQKVNSF